MNCNFFHVMPAKISIQCVVSLFIHVHKLGLFLIKHIALKLNEFNVRVVH